MDDDQLEDLDQADLIDSMVEGFIQDVSYQFNLATDPQAVFMIKESLARLGVTK